MNAWVSGIGYSSLALASLVGLKGHLGQSSIAAPPGLIAANIPVIPQSDFQEGAEELLTFDPMSRGRKDPAHNLRQTYEDIEIYRRLLTRSLMPFTSGEQRSTLANQTTFLRLVTPTVVTNEHPTDRFLNQGKSQSPSERFFTHDKPNPHADIEYHSLRVEGVRLPQGGIVFTADVPGKLTLPATKKPEKQRPQLSDWERVRLEFRGEKVEVAAKTDRQDQPHVVDAVLHSLAENGQHLSGLTPDQNVTVVLTFRGAWTQQCMKCHTNVTASHTDIPPGSERSTTSFTDAFPSGANLNSFTGNQTDNLLGSSPPRTGDEQSSSRTFNPLGAQLNSSSHSYGTAPGDQAILGDLHFKQGRFDEAVAAYSKSLQEVSANSAKELDTLPTSASPKLRGLVLKLIELQNKIIQCEAALKHEEKVEQGVAKLSRWTARLEQIEMNSKKAKADKTEKVKASAPALPEKLIVVASKGLLDRVGKHQMTFEDFKALARVEYVKFDSTEK
jgi:hypothetical protein